MASETRLETASRLRDMAAALEAGDRAHVVAIYYHVGEHTGEGGPEVHIATTDALWMARMMLRSAVLLLNDVDAARAGDKETLH